jgi:hypothetical protein
MVSIKGRAKVRHRPHLYKRLRKVRASDHLAAGAGVLLHLLVLDVHPKVGEALDHLVHAADA